MVVSLLLVALLSIANLTWSATINVTPNSVAQGANVTVSWTGVAPATPTDWFGLYPQGGSNYVAWRYLNCILTATVSVPTGSCSFQIPSIASGNYEVKLLANDGFNVIATSNVFGVGVAPPTGLVDNNNGTVTDTRTGLTWGKKTGFFLFPNGAPKQCLTLSDCPDPNNIDNHYTWSSSGVAADGSLFTDFLERVNGTLCESTSCRGLGGYSDWRIPTLAELNTIHCGNCGDCGVHSVNPCVMPVFIPSGGIHNIYWSASTFASSLTSAYVVYLRINPSNAGIPRVACGQIVAPPLPPGSERECFAKGAGFPAFAVRGGPQEK